MGAHRHTDAVLVEVGPHCAGETALATPGCAEGVGGAIEGVGVDDAASRGEDEASVAGEAVSVAVPGGALVADLLADAFGIEEPSLRALNADLSVPLGAAVVDGGPLTAAVDYGVALIAGLTDSLGLVELTAVVVDLAADSFLIEGVSVGAFEALVLRPGFASVVIGHVD